MTCREFRELAPCLARREPLMAALLRDADEHRVECADCARYFENQETLNASLRGLAASRRDALPPKRVEGCLREAFARRQALISAAQLPARTADSRRTLWMAGAIGALAATVVALFLLLAQSRKLEQPTPEPARQAAAPPASGPEDSAPEVAAAEVPVRPAVRPSRPARAAQPGLLEDTYEPRAAFLPLATPVTRRDVDGAQIVRVRLSRAGLAALGIPVLTPGTEGTVTADVLIGQDGMAKAIRFVR